MRIHKILCFVVLAAVCWACKKTPAGPPPVFANATIALVDVEDSSFLPSGENSIIRAKVNGPSTDYSYLIAYVVDVDASHPDTVSRSQVGTDGGIQATIPGTIAPGIHTFKIVASNSFDLSQNVSSEIFTFFIGIPRPVRITLIEKDDVSNTVHWSRSDIPNFAAYELYAIRTDEIPDRDPIPDGRLVGRVTDRDVLSLRDDSIYFYYKYSYMIKVINDQGESTKSEREQIISGSFIEIGYETYKSIYDQPRRKIYLYDGRLKIIDPQLLTVEDSIDLPGPLHYMRKNPSGTSIDVIIKYDVDSFQLASVDLVNHQLTLLDKFKLNQNNVIIKAYMNRTVFYTMFEGAPVFSNVAIAQNIDDGQSQVVLNREADGIQPISNNRLLISAWSDSIYVYQQSGANFSLQKKVYGSGSDYFVDFLGAYESPGFVSVGTVLYDQNFNIVHDLGRYTGDHPNIFIGMSNDGQYVATLHNEIINTSTLQVERVYGDGFGTVAFFSADNSTLYHFTEDDLGIRWNPPPRLFRFPWR